jgi:hypothetical protein
MRSAVRPPVEAALAVITAMFAIHAGHTVLLLYVFFFEDCLVVFCK